jgi:GNAT superfamily N-acetyltransferase
VKIRPAREADSPHIALLLEELGYRANPSQVRDRLKSTPPLPAVHLVAESTSGIVAFLTACLIPYFPDGSTLCRITAMMVSTAYRRTGVGGALVEAAAKYAEQHGCSGLEVTSAEGRVEAHRFYERNGFSRTSSRFYRPL